MRRTTIRLYRSDLLRYSACSRGLSLYDKFAAAQGKKHELRIPVNGLLWASCHPKTRGFFEWALERGLLLPARADSADLSNADLRRAKLSYASLKKANLQRVKLYRADLVRANLSNACLQNADMRKALCFSASFRRCDLSSADLREAVLTFADFDMATLRNADLRGVDLCRTSLRGANLDGARRSIRDTRVVGWVVRKGVLVRDSDTV